MANLQFSFKTDWGPISGAGGDAFFYKDNLFIVAEGLGGDHVGEIARDLSCQVISDSFFKYMSEVPAPAEAMTKALRDANQALLDEIQNRGRKLAATVSVLYIQNHIMYFSHLGDSRIYCIHGGQINQLTRDHTLQEQVPITPSKPYDSRVMQALTQGLGINDHPLVEVKKYPLERKALVILTTEGFTSRVSNREILRYAQKYRNIHSMSRDILALARKKGGDREMTLGIIRFGVLSKTTKTIVTVYTSLALVAALLFMWYITQFGGQKPGPEPQVSVETGPTTVPALEKEEQPTEIAPKQTRKIIQPTPPLSFVKEDTTRSVVQAEEIQAFLRAWKSAWEKTAGDNQEMAPYMALYSKDFYSRGMSRESWARDKSSKGRSKEWISVVIDQVNITGTSDDEIKVSFRQQYRSSNYASTSPKSLVLRKENGQWKVLREISP